MHRRTALIGASLLGGMLFLAACGGAADTCPEAVCPEPAVDVPFAELWAASPHADASAEAFVHWDAEDPPEIPADCARCHSEAGYLDFLGVDGTAPGEVNNPAAVGSVITCVTCHNDATAALTSVVFPSGVEVTGLGDEARCMVCHQGRASTMQVDEGIAALSLASDDTVSADLGFTNIHYFAAAATQYGTIVQGGYQYAGQAYDARTRHVPAFDTCAECHNPHSLEVELAACATCHTGVTSVEDVRAIRMAGSLIDYDGDGDAEEGIYFEIEGLRGMLLRGLQAYSSEVAGAAIAYSPEAYPYFFVDTNGNGVADPDEAIFPNRYVTWTPRLVRAAYNYQVSLKDPGAYAHGGKYIVQLLYDSIADLNTALSTPIDLSAAHRIDPGHFAGSTEAFRHWDAEGVVPGACTRCHTAEGLPFYLREGVNVSGTPSNGLACATCHDNETTFTRFAVEQVTFPSGAQLALPNPEANLCLNCHQGRESTVSVNAAITRAGVGDDEVSSSLTFRNVHYFAAGATLFGTEARGAYEYAAQTYVGRFQHVQGYDTCVDCHNTHALEVQVDSCRVCHATATSVEALSTIRMPGSAEDFDGDGDTTEGIAGEIATLREALFAALQAYAADTVGTGIVYSDAAYPYFFADSNGNGLPDPDELNFGNRYTTWTPRLLRAAYNYQYASKDPGGFAHNSRYLLQVLYDSLADLRANTAGMVRP
jgi:hypothetical protein